MDRRRLLFAYIVIAAGLWFGQFTVQAGTIYDSPYVSFSPDMRAWTTNAGDRNVEWYAEDGTDDVIAGGVRTLRELRVGEHYYAVRRGGSVPIAKWQVSLSQVRCCHNSYPKSGYYHGVPFVMKTCNKPHFSAWRPICADCGERIAALHFYMSRDAAASLDYLEVGQQIDYYYLCPFNGNLEQGAPIAYHNCKDISYNRYQVIYAANTGGEAYGGYMASSYHMYNNAREYEGREVTPQTRLNPNTYTRTGWEFTGWNTKPDGSGTGYSDEAKIWNLCSGDYKADGAAGTVRLYAMWRRSQGSLRINPSGGKYAGSAGITSVTGFYGEDYRIEKELIEAPAGCLLSFDTMGGENMPALQGTMHFCEWRRVEPFMGRLSGDTYHFYVPDGNQDEIRAVYEFDAVVLPCPVRQNYSFGGWYYDRELEKFAGGAGAQLNPGKDITLYARWVELVLTSKDNYEENDGKGAVDLSWCQPDGRNKLYRLYQSDDAENWKQVYTADAVGQLPDCSERYDFSGEKAEYTIPYDGYYHVTAYGAQGSQYKGADLSEEENTEVKEENAGSEEEDTGYDGGLGGQVSGSFWLRKGEKLTINVGGQNGYNGGGDSEKYGNGGGYSEVVSDLQGLLLIAGGGGGAGMCSEGMPGGISVEELKKLKEDRRKRNGDKAGSGQREDGRDDIWDNSQNNNTQHDNQDGRTGAEGVTGGGGGGGYLGGCAGETRRHYHVRGVCNHVHSGTPTSGGACYKAVTCGKALKHVHTGVEKWYWGGSDEEYCPNCGRTDDCTGHERDIYKHVCEEHGVQKRNYKENSPSVCKAATGYRLSCGKGTDFICGFPYDGCIESFDEACGGCNYVNEKASRSRTDKAGVNQGDGFVLVELEEIVGTEEPLMKGVIAGDKAAPDSVAMEGVEQTPAEDKVIIRWQAPKDNGTTYYHMVKSYPAGAGETDENRACISNITVNTLVSGVKGFYFSLDTSPDTRLTQQNAEFTLTTRLQVTLTDENQYLHVQTSDFAGNVSESIHIPVGKRFGDKNVKWPVHTNQLKIPTAENVCAAEDVYFVRSDGKTPFSLEYGAWMEGVASENYQLTRAILESRCADAAPVRDTIHVPICDTSANSAEFPAAELRFEAEGQCLIQNAGYVTALRSYKCRRLDVRQELLLDKAAHGERIELVPIAGVDDRGAQDGEVIVYSDYQEDRQNGIYVIGDGEPPEIMGLEMLEDTPLLDRREGSFALRVTARDELSGLKELYLEVENLDNGVTKKFYPDASGAVVVDISVDEPIFSGEFTVTACAKDNVGNESKSSCGTMEFDLQARIERMLEPKTPQFKRGESGCLKIRAWGYVDRIEVEFPEEFTREDASLNRKYVYDLNHSYMQEEECVFMIPLYLLQNGDYTVTVRAYKGEQMLESYPALAVFGVEGSILDELHTRLR